MSLRLRFALAMLAWVGAGLILVGVGTSALFRQHVEAQFHDELAVHLAELSGLTHLRADGRPVLDRPLSDPRYAIPGSGYYWQVTRHGLPPLSSASLVRGRLDPAVAHAPHLFHRLAAGPSGPAMTYGMTRPAPDGGPELHFLIATDERHLDQVIHAFDHELWRWLALMALALAGTGALVVLFALRPLGRLAVAVGAVRSGRSQRMEGRWPTEIAPLVSDLNALIAAQEAMVNDARIEAGNLAHGLRTALAILTDEAETLARDTAGDSAATLLEQCRRIERQLDWHLARARASARGPMAGPGTRLPEALEPILAAMARLHQGRAIAFRIVADQPAVLAIDPLDFGEIVSNLADNAGKWAAHEVILSWTEADDRLVLSVSDDGPGIPPHLRQRLFTPGDRLDEAVPGHGLGLAIARDLARKAGGDVVLEGRPDGKSGLRAVVLLPLRR